MIEPMDIINNYLDHLGAPEASDGADGLDTLDALEIPRDQLTRLSARVLYQKPDDDYIEFNLQQIELECVEAGIIAGIAFVRALNWAAKSS